MQEVRKDPPLLIVITHGRETLADCRARVGGSRHRDRRAGGFGCPRRVPQSAHQHSRQQGHATLQISYYSAFFLAPDGSLWTWGESTSLFTKPTSVPQQVGRGTDWKRIAHRFT
jgi:hypothetical protein